MVKLLCTVFFVFLFWASNVFALNESTKPSKINIYLEENPPFSSFNLQKEAQGLYVDYWKQWSSNSGISIKFLPTLEKNLVGLLADHVPSIYSGMNIDEHTIKNTKLIKSELVSIETHYYYFSDNAFIQDDPTLDKSKAIVIGGLLRGADKLPEFMNTDNLIYKPFPGLLEVVMSLYLNEIDAFVLFTSPDAQSGWLDQLLSSFLKSKLTIYSGNSLSYYSTKDQAVLLEWVDWGKQGLAKNVMTQSLTNNSANYWGLSLKMVRNVAIISFILLVLIWLAVAKRKKDQQFKSILDSSPYPLIILSLDGNKIFYLNDAVKVLFPFKESKNSYYFEEEENQTLFSTFISKASHQNIIETSLTRLIIDKIFHDIEISANRVHYKRGSAWLCYLKDVTALLSAEKKLIEEQALLRTVLDAIPEEICYKSAEGVIIGCNEGWASAHKSTIEEAKGQLLSEFLSDKQQEKQPHQDKTVWEGHDFTTQEWSEEEEDKRRLVHVTKVPLPDAQGGIFGILSVDNDITDFHDLTNKLKDENTQRIATEHALLQQSLLLKTVFDVTGDAIVLLDGDHKVIESNQRFLQLIGLDKSSLSGVQLTDLNIKNSDWIFQDNAKLSANETIIFEVLINFNELETWFEIHKAPFTDAVSQSQWVVVIAKNISALKKYELDSLSNNNVQERVVNNEELPQIPQRKSFELYFSSLWLEAQEENEMLSIVLCDIDNFSAFNEKHGKEKGNEALPAFALKLQEAQKSVGCLLACYKQDEFIFVFKGGNATKALKTTEKIFALAHEIQIEGELLTVSMGLSSMFPSGINTKEMLVAEAHLAIEDAKLSGRHQIGVH